MAKQSNMSSDLANLITGSSGEVTLSSTEDVQVMVCNGVTLPILLKFIAKVSKDLGLSLSDAAGIRDKLLSKVDDVSFMLDLIAGYADDVYILISYLTSLETAEDVALLRVDDLIKVMTKVVEVNTDFFTGQVLPLLKGVGATGKAK